jgi:hypothetical protein
LSLVLLVAGLAGRSAAQDTPRERPPEPPAPMAAPTTAAPAITETAPPRPTWRVDVDYIAWWFHNGNLPSLLNTAPENNATTSGTAADPNARALFPKSDGISYNSISGIRFGVGYSLDDDGHWAVEGNGFFLDRPSIGAFFAGTNGTPFLTRPFFNVASLAEGGYDVSSKFSGFSGNIAFDASSRFWGWEANVAYFDDWKNSKVNKVVFGFRALTLTESLSVLENAFGVAGFQGTPIAADQTDQILDSFNTTNHFYGAQVGVNFRWACGPVAFDFLPKIAVGVNHETLHTFGSTTLLAPDGTILAGAPGGILALASNSGHFSRDELTVVPEINLKISCDLTCCTRLHLGYNLIYMSSVVRPGDQVDRRIDPQQVPSDLAFSPTTATPFPRGWFRDTDFFAHGVNFGVELHW